MGSPTLAEATKTTGTWYNIGFAEGAEAGSSDMSVLESAFGLLEDALAMGHAMLGGDTPPFVAARLIFNHLKTFRNG